MSKLGYLVTLLVGSALAWFSVNPLAFLVFLFIWIDVLLLARLNIMEMIGFELLTLASVVSGIALGPVPGLIFSAVGLPVLATALTGAARGTFIPRTPSFDYVAMGVSALAAGLLVGQVSFFVAVFVSVLLKPVIMNAINLFMGSGLSVGSATISVLFNWFVIIVLNAAGVLGVFA